MKKISIFIILVLVIGTIFYFWQADKAIESKAIISEEQTWTLSFQFSDNETNDIILTNNKILSLAEITKLISIQESWEYKFDDYGDMGILVTQIKDYKNGQDQKYWQYFVDGEQPQISADKYLPPNNTYITWKFIESEF